MTALTEYCNAHTDTNTHQTVPLSLLFVDADCGLSHPTSSRIHFFHAKKNHTHLIVGYHCIYVEFILRDPLRVCLYLFA